MSRLSDRNPQRQHQQRSGRPKRAFTSQEEAQTYADHLSRKGAAPMEAYQCGVCGLYHNGHDSRPTKSLRAAWNQNPELGYRAVNAMILENRGIPKTRRKHIRKRLSPLERTRP